MIVIKKMQKWIIVDGMEEEVCCIPNYGTIIEMELSTFKRCLTEILRMNMFIDTDTSKYSITSNKDDFIVIKHCISRCERKTNIHNISFVKHSNETCSYSFNYNDLKHFISKLHSSKNDTVFLYMDKRYPMMIILNNNETPYMESVIKIQSIIRMFLQRRLDLLPGNYQFLLARDRCQKEGMLL